MEEDSNLSPTPVVGRTSRRGIWMLGIGLVVIAALIFLAKGMM